jgi:hypothetical protein
LKRVALRDDALGLALRSIALARLGDHVRAPARGASLADPASSREEICGIKCGFSLAETLLAIN